MKFTIGPIEYEVREVEDLGDRLVRYSSLILVDKNQEPQYRKHVLWHEIIHILLTHAHIELGDQQAEQVCDALSYGILQVLRDNKETLHDQIL